MINMTRVWDKEKYENPTRTQEHRAGALSTELREPMERDAI